MASASTRSPRVIQIVFWLALLAFVSLAFLSLVKAFLLPVVWAITLAIIFHPLYRRLRDRMPTREGLAATLTTVLIFFVVLLPVAGIVAAMVNEGFAIYGKIQSGEYDPQAMIGRVQDRIPIVQQFLTERGVDMTGVQARINETAASLGQTAVTYVTNALSNVAGLVVSFFVMLYLIYFFLKDGYNILGKIIEALPLGDEHEWRMFSRFGATARATIKGSVIVGIVQGLIGGIAFAVLGISGPVFWGVIMAIASLIPSVGTALVWAPAAIYLLSTGDVVQGVALIVIGGGLIGMVDNFLRPLLVGRESGVPDWIVLLVSFGGIASFGLSGLIIGPVVAALFLTVWDQFSDEFNVTEDLIAAVLQTTKEPDAVTAETTVAGANTGAAAAADPAVAGTAATSPAAPDDGDVAPFPPRVQARLDNEKASVAMHVVIASDAARDAATNAARAGLAATHAVEHAADEDVTGAAQAATVAEGAAEGATAAATTAVDAAASVQMSAEFIRQKIEGDVSPEAHAVVEAAAQQADSDANAAQASADTAQAAADTAQQAVSDAQTPPDAPPSSAEAAPPSPGA